MAAGSTTTLKIVETKTITIRGPQSQNIANWIADKVNETQSSYTDGLISPEDLGDTETTLFAETAE
jgi:hypothetical protein